jgi:16S rRNA (guanine966-N2)-methyltransferase
LTSIEVPTSQRAQTRITGGAWRGRRILTPPGLKLRPTRAMVREALFNILGAEIVGGEIVDVFAGAGSVGFEALSRGAAHATFVESSGPALRLVAETAARLHCVERMTLVGVDATAWLRRRPPEVVGARLCFVDAPYRDDQVLTVLTLLGDLAAPLVVCEHHRDRRMPASLGALRAVRTARYGLTSLTFFRRSEDAQRS